MLKISQNFCALFQENYVNQENWWIMEYETKIIFLLVWTSPLWYLSETYLSQHVYNIKNPVRLWVIYNLNWLQCKCCWQIITKSNNNEPYNEPTCANYTFHICGIKKPKSEKSPSPNYLLLDYIDFIPYSHACLHIALFGYFKHLHKLSMHPQKRQDSKQ